MKIVLRAIISILVGCGAYVVLLVSVFRFHPPVWISRGLLWNVSLFSFVGRGEPIGRMPNGEPVYDGAAGIAGHSYESILTGFVIYPLIVFVAISMMGRYFTKPTSSND